MSGIRDPHERAQLRAFHCHQARRAVEAARNYRQMAAEGWNLAPGQDVAFAARWLREAGEHRRKALAILREPVAPTVPLTRRHLEVVLSAAAFVLRNRGVPERVVLEALLAATEQANDTDSGEFHHPGAIADIALDFARQRRGDPSPFGD